MTLSLLPFFLFLSFFSLPSFLPPFLPFFLPSLLFFFHFAIRYQSAKSPSKTIHYTVAVCFSVYSMQHILVLCISLRLCCLIYLSHNEEKNPTHLYHRRASNPSRCQMRRLKHLSIDCYFYLIEEITSEIYLHIIQEFFIA